MNSFVDRDAGFAAFRQGRSVCLRLDGHVDIETALAIQRQLRDHDDATRLRLECSTLRRIDAEAASYLARSLLAWARQHVDRSIEILNLDAGIRRTDAWRPLRAVTDPEELIFFDPDPDPEVAGGPRASRH